MGTFGNYIRLLEKIDAFTAEIRDKHPLSFNCGPGCSACCVGGITVWRVEFDHIIERFQKSEVRITDHLPAGQAGGSPATKSSAGGRITNNSCLFLDENGHCAIYDSRPVVCRLWGTPLMIPVGHEHEWGIHSRASSQSAKGTLICCDQNFARGRSLEELSLADAINSQTVIQALAAINHVYCKKQDLDPTARYAISEVLA